MQVESTGPRAAKDFFNYREPLLETRRRYHKIVCITAGTDNIYRQLRAELQQTPSGSKVIETFESMPFVTLIHADAMSPDAMILPDQIHPICTLSGLQMPERTFAPEKFARLNFSGTKAGIGRDGNVVSPVMLFSLAAAHMAHFLEPIAERLAKYSALKAGEAASTIQASEQYVLKHVLAPIAQERNEEFPTDGIAAVVAVHGIKAVEPACNRLSVGLPFVQKKLAKLEARKRVASQLLQIEYKRYQQLQQDPEKQSADLEFLETRLVTLSRSLHAVRIEQDGKLDEFKLFGVGKPITSIQPKFDSHQTFAEQEAEFLAHEASMKNATAPTSSVMPPLRPRPLIQRVRPMTAGRITASNIA